MNINERLSELRKLMAEKNMDAYIVPTADPHQSEYVADCYQCRIWISGFTGSAGTVVITKDKALLWTDGRYFIQAAKEIKDSEFELMKMATPGYPTYPEWLSENLEKGNKIGFDGKVMSQKLTENLETILKDKDIEFINKFDLINDIWTDRPEVPKTKAFLHDIEYTGLTASEKLSQVRGEMEEIGADYFIIGGLDDIAWLFNIRGRDVKSNPVNISYALISKEEAFFCVDNEKLDEEIVKDLNSNGVTIKEYEDILNLVKNIDEDSTVVLDKSKINSWLFSGLNKQVKVIDTTDITTNLKAIKNEVEIENQRNAYIKDGVAMTKLFYWIGKKVENDEEVSELSAQNKLEEIRKDLWEDYIEPSFGSISAYGPNAAMMHYSATEESYSIMENKGMYLLDAGAQFLDGTTDTTRTIAIGEVTDEEKEDFTRTLKGHIDLISTKFLKGANGYMLDSICRRPLWNIGSDYKCGTGHGVGYLLNVHEGPHRISQVYNDVAFEEGMIVTIEPGVYKSGKHGIRIENVVVVQEDVYTDSGQFMSFETLSFVPIDLNCIDVDLLDNEQKSWLNKYHKEVYNKLSPFMNEEERVWLEEKTKEI